MKEIAAEIRTQRNEKQGLQRKLLITSNEFLHNIKIKTSTQGRAISCWNHRVAFMSPEINDQYCIF